MKNYTKHQIKRIKVLNEDYFEVVFGRESLKFQPGAAVKLYNGPDFPVFIASGVGEPWLRLIMSVEKFGEYFPVGTRSIKLQLEVNNLLPSLELAESPNFVLDAGSIGAFFSWASTYPSKKCKVCYLDDVRIQEDWVSANHTVVKPAEAKKLRNLYVTGNRDLFTGRRKKLLNTCKESYLYE